MLYVYKLLCKNIFHFSLIIVAKIEILFQLTKKMLSILQFCFVSSLFIITFARIK